MRFFVFLTLVVVTSNAHLIRKREAGDQQPKIWDALKQLGGGKSLTVSEIQEIYKNAVPGQDYPINAVITEKEVDCKAYKQAGFYADDSEASKCQIFHRCDENGNVKSFLCPNMTLFNQITLVCDWFYNIDCSVSKNFVDYSNSRLADEKSPLLDDQTEIESVEAATGGREGKAMNESPSAPDADKSAVEPTSAPAVEATTDAPTEAQSAETTAVPVETATTEATTEGLVTSASAAEAAAATEASTDAPAAETPAATGEVAAPSEASTEPPATEVTVAEPTVAPAEAATEAPATDAPVAETAAASEAPAAEDTTAASSGLELKLIQ